MTAEESPGDSSEPVQASPPAKLLPVAVFGAWLLAVVITGALAFTNDWPGAVAAWVIAAGVGLFATAVTLPLLMSVASRVARADADALIRLSSLVLGAGMIRVVVVGLGITLPVKLYEAATWPTFGFVATHYLLLTAAEVGVLGRLFWQKDETHPAPAKPDS